jgi:hypothetical protein
MVFTCTPSSANRPRPRQPLDLAAPREIYLISSPTRPFSSFNSLTEASILARLKSFTGTSCTTSHLPPLTRMGKELIRPSSTP